MNINPYGQTTPHYDSYEDFYKFFEVHPERAKEDVSVEVFPPVERREKIGEVDQEHGQDEDEK